SRVWAEDKPGRVIYPVAVPVYQAQFLADKLGYFKEAGLDCKLIQGGGGVKTREIIASQQGDIGIGDITHPMQLSNRGRNGRVLMPVDTRSSAGMFILPKAPHPQGGGCSSSRRPPTTRATKRWRSLRHGSGRTTASRSSRCLRLAAPTMS